MVMARTALQVQSKDKEAGKEKPAGRRQVEPLTLPKHLKPLTGPTGMKPSY
jgi:hypothetical protein